MATASENLPDMPVVKRIFRNGRTSVGVVLPPQFRRVMNLAINDYAVLRLRTVQGRSFIIIEKLMLSKLAKPPALPVDVLPSER